MMVWEGFEFGSLRVVIDIACGVDWDVIGKGRMSSGFGMA